jgi:calcium-translocating P-type ATPase
LTEGVSGALTIISDAHELSRWIVGDPETIEAVGSLEGLFEALGLPLPRAPGLLPLAPGIALVHSLTGTTADPELRWVRLERLSAIRERTPPVDQVAILVAPLSECHRALRLVSSLMSGLQDPVVAARLRGERSRHGLIRLLHEAATRNGEMSLRDSDLWELLDTGVRGLSSAEASRRLHVLGANQLQRVRRRSMGWSLAEQLGSLFALLLWVGGALAFLAGMPQLGWAIFGVIVVNGVFSFLQEYRAERATEALASLLPRTITVVRDGVSSRVPASSIVAGDLARMEEGDQISADGQIVESQGLRVDQGPLSGESHPVLKLPAAGHEHAAVPIEERHELVFAGTNVVAGAGTMVACATGMRTQVGRIARLTQEVREKPSPLQRELGRVTRVVAVLALAFGVGFFAIGVATGLFPVRDGLLFGLGVIVANVPEGLMPTLTLALAWGVLRMARRRSLVKRLSSVEALGAITVICTDKTGTLTENRMQARTAWAAGQSWNLTDSGGSPAAVRELFEAATLASLATSEHGDPLEQALVAAGERAGADPEALRAARSLVAPFPFDSFRKRMTLVHREGAALRAYVKGAPRETIALCTHVRRGDETVPLDDGIRADVLGEHDRLADEGLRLLAVAVRDLSAWHPGIEEKAVERDLVLIGLVALWDPPRPEVAGAVSLCRRAGIRVVVVTGDDPLTAASLCRGIGLPIRRSVTGPELETLSRDALHALVRTSDLLFARVSPADKLAVVQALKDQDEVVAVTGDGVNDAPALKAADVGVAMGRRGSDVAREAAAMVITDDNFASIVAAVRQGRAVYSNVGKFVTYIFASNAAEVAPFMAAAMFGVPLPLTVMQILAVDLGTDLLPALGLGAERPETDVMDRPPRPRTERLLHARRLAHAYGFLGVVEAGLSLAGFFFVYWSAGWRPGLPMSAEGDLYARATTMTFAGIVAAQIGNVFACRTERESVFRAGLLGNRLVLCGIGFELLLLLLLVHLPGLARLFGLAPLHAGEWTLLLLYPPAVLGLEEARKWWLRRREARRRSEERRTNAAPSRRSW